MENAAGALGAPELAPTPPPQPELPGDAAAAAACDQHRWIDLREQLALAHMIASLDVHLATRPPALGADRHVVARAIAPVMATVAATSPATGVITETSGTSSASTLRPVLEDAEGDAAASRKPTAPPDDPGPPPLEPSHQLPVNAARPWPPDANEMRMPPRGAHVPPVRDTPQDAESQTGAAPQAAVTAAGRLALKRRG
jgi:hypothetical protein